MRAFPKKPVRPNRPFAAPSEQAKSKADTVVVIEDPDCPHAIVAGPRNEVAPFTGVECRINLNNRGPGRTITI